VRLCDLLGGARRGAMAQLRIVPLKAPDEMAAMAAKLVREGYRFLKVKASGDAALDLARVRAVREAAGPAVRLMVDANQTYAPRRRSPRSRGGRSMASSWSSSRPPGDDPAGLAAVTRATTVAIEADESAQSLAEIARLARERTVDSINLRIMNLGGIRAVLAAVAICEGAGIAYRFGATFGPRLFQAQLRACRRDPAAHRLRPRARRVQPYPRRPVHRPRGGRRRARPAARSRLRREPARAHATGCGVRIGWISNAAPPLTCIALLERPVCCTPLPVGEGKARSCRGKLQQSIASLSHRERAATVQRLSKCGTGEG
jgi:L-alanine-DL-glutamate epimerase-like enolase superfamily enzyme